MGSTVERMEEDPPHLDAQQHLLHVLQLAAFLRMSFIGRHWD